MHDRKVVRRRRAVLGLLVGCALILLTAYFGEGSGGGLHAIQRGALAIFSPIESVASDAVKPFRDLFGWFDDTFNAKGENSDLKKEVQQLRVEVADQQERLRLSTQLEGVNTLIGAAGLSAMKPVNAKVVISSPSIWYSTVNINRGSNDGVSVNDPVINADGLVGVVLKTVGDAAQVQLITDAHSGVTARTQGAIPGIVQTGSPGNPNDLVMQRIPRGKVPKVGDMVTTAGIQSTRFTSFFPARIPIGTVSKVDRNELDTSQQVHVKPYADLHDLDVLTVLTEPTTRSLGPKP
ncbi:MAG: rod shape-determining protein MreC [Solirubrobacterales bacterium]|nr:rod shape-determining protein MreC [Solirubrobacterales bacterium]